MVVNPKFVVHLYATFKGDSKVFLVMGKSVWQWGCSGGAVVRQFFCTGRTFRFFN